jgi:hypothetical protein
MAQNRAESDGVPANLEHFATELRVYEKNKPKWLREEANQFVVICADDVAGFFPTFTQAYEAALRRFGVDRLFLIKQVLPQDRIFVVY